MDIAPTRKQKIGNFSPCVRGGQPLIIALWDNSTMPRLLTPTHGRMRQLRTTTDAVLGSASRARCGRTEGAAVTLSLVEAHVSGASKTVGSNVHNIC